MLPLFQAACRLGIKSFISGLIHGLSLLSTFIRFKGRYFSMMSLTTEENIETDRYKSSYDTLETS